MKKKLLVALTAMLVAMSLFASVGMAKSENAKKSLVALGDSITTGYNLGVNNHHPSKDAFPSLIGEEADLRVRNLGVPGWTTVDLLNALKDDKYRDAIRHADYITLDIGSNDLRVAYAEYETTKNMGVLQFKIGQTLERLQAIIVEVRLLTDAPIVLYNIYNPYPAGTPIHIASDQLLTLINNSISFIAGVYGLAYADAFEAYGDNQVEYVLPNDIHPTVAGQGALADIGLEALGLE
jgi:lysophospholipase L1-like esterase